MGKLRRGWHRKFGKRGIWEVGESRGWGWRLFVPTMWLPASPRDREGQPRGSVKTEAVWLESWPQWLRETGKTRSQVLSAPNPGSLGSDDCGKAAVLGPQRSRVMGQKLQ